MKNKATEVYYNYISSLIMSFFKDDNAADGTNYQNLISSSVVNNNAIRINLTSPVKITNLMKCMYVERNNNRIRMHGNLTKVIGIFGNFDASATYKFDIVEYEFHNAGFEDRIDSELPNTITVMNVTSFSIKFIDSSDNTEIEKNPIHTLRLLSNHNYYFKKILLRLLVINNIGLSSNPFYISDDYVQYVNQKEYVDQHLISEFIFFKKNIPAYTNGMSTFQNIPTTILNVYLIALPLNEYISLDWNEYNTVFDYFVTNANKIGFNLVYQGNNFYLNFFDYNSYTIDLIHMKEGNTVFEYVKEYCSNYSCILNGPFFEKRYIGIASSSYKAPMVGYRKFRHTNNNVPVTLNSKNQTLKEIFVRKVTSEDKDLPAKIIVDTNNNVNFLRGLLTDEEVENANCAFDSMAFCYNTELGASSPLNPASSIHADLLLEQNTGHAAIPHNGMPFIGLVSRVLNGIERTFLITLVLEENHKIPNPFLQVFQMMSYIHPDFLLFTDGSDSVYLNYMGKNIPVKFGENYKNNVMPCLIGIIEKSKL